MKSKINIPTKITLLRIFLVIGLLVYLAVMGVLAVLGKAEPIYLGNSNITVVGLVSTIVFIVAASTDAVDGHLARKWNQVTDFGKFLDPIADKMLVNSDFLLLPLGFSRR